MMLFLASVMTFAVAMALMAIGLLFGNRRITGVCGRDCGCEREADE